MRLPERSTRESGSNRRESGGSVAIDNMSFPAKCVPEIELNLYRYTVMQPVCRNLLGSTNFYVVVAGLPSFTWVITRSLAAVLPMTQVILDCNKQVTASG